MEKMNIAIAGAGVVGLAAASELARDYPEIFVIERNPAFGQEISSRNSEVIHAGIYYPAEALKTKACIEGRRLLYAFCQGHGVKHKKIGKLVVAIDKNEVSDLDVLFRQAEVNGVEGLRWLSKTELKALEPRVAAEAAIFSPETGILDSHGLMQSLLAQFESRGGQAVFNTEVIAAEKSAGGFLITVKDKTGESFRFFTRVFINSCGLNSDKVAAFAGRESPEYKLKYCKGDYFRVHGAKASFIRRLVYPVPKKDRAGLGIHATLDLANGLRLGPDDEYVKGLDYNIDAAKSKAFFQSVRTFLPFVEESELRPDTAGIRPKLQGPGEGFRDFLIREEGDAGLPGWINLIGIESPGLTAALSIAKMVRELARRAD
ncbi:MAG: hypothetical protein A3G38_00755 [Omnitrophica WOR_2 bacterium RIFCSPLOWO2_12_FULL_51_8]|nr:MAG: hypothetical protein A3G38_00755 [Omnitrophica WOR_2 bacterium RIFCSPLOWO2_12_FULL_51_8]